MKKKLIRTNEAVRGRSRRGSNGPTLFRDQMSEDHIRAHIERHRKDIEMILARGAVASVVVEPPAGRRHAAMLRAWGWDGDSQVFAIEHAPGATPTRTVALCLARGVVAFRLPELN